MSHDFLDRVRALSTAPTHQHPNGLRQAVLERAAIMHFDGGLSVDAADAAAWDLLVGGKQTRLVGT